MLSAAHRLRSSTEFSRTVRGGRRATRGSLTVHVLLPEQPGNDEPARVGFVVSKAVGGSVVRHRVARRLRHLVRERLELLPPGSRLVVRAGRDAAEASSATLAGDLDAALVRAVRR